MKVIASVTITVNVFWLLIFIGIMLSNNNTAKIFTGVIMSFLLISDICLFIWWYMNRSISEESLLEEVLIDSDSDSDISEHWL